MRFACFFRTALAASGLLLAVALTFATPPPQAAAAERSEVYAGYRSLVTRLAQTRMRLDVAVWYPTRRRPSTIQTGTWSLQAARDAAPLPGPWPLLILSHDSSGSRFSHHELAAALAVRGFIVAAPTHDGDNADDMRLLFSDLQLPTRALQLSATLDLVLADPTLGPQVDRQRIGLTAFGRTGLAGLLLAGAELTPDIWGNWCADTSARGERSPYCEPFIAGKMDALTAAMRTRSLQAAEAAIMRERAMASRQAMLDSLTRRVSRAHERARRGQRREEASLPPPPVYLPPLPPLPENSRLTDPRFSALALVSPGFVMLLEPASLPNVRLPVLLVGLDRDPLDLPSQQAAPLRDMLTATRPQYHELAVADLPALQSACPPKTAPHPPDLCGTVSPEKRASLRTQLETMLTDFFTQAWR